MSQDPGSGMDRPGGSSPDTSEPTEGLPTPSDHDRSAPQGDGWSAPQGDGWNETTSLPMQHDTTPLPTQAGAHDLGTFGSPAGSDTPAATAAPPQGWGDATRPEPLGPLVQATPWGPPSGAAAAFPPPPGWVAPSTARGRSGRGRRALAAVGMLLAALVAGVLGGTAGAGLYDRFGAEQVEIPVATGTTERSDDSVAGVAARVLPSTVSIEVSAPGIEGSGSGFVLRADGLIVTNNHVVADAADGGGEIQVVFSDGSQEEAEVVGRTVDYDLAVLRVDRDDLVPLTFGDSDSVVVGDPVIAIGAPLGLEATVTTGIVSALNRPVVAGNSNENAFINAIQTDAAINPGNSGGPLVNAVGEVIGVNSAIARNPGSGEGPSGSIGLGFAIPSQQVARTSEQLIETGKATYPVIGVLLDRSYTGEGVKVAEDADEPPVVPGGPADEAGILPGDVITEFNGRPVTEPDELIVGIRAQVPGDTVRLTVRTGDEEREVEVVLDEEDSN